MIELSAHDRDILEQQVRIAMLRLLLERQEITEHQFYDAMERLRGKEAAA